ncbi:conserved hypothetical protein [delta proteobacterium NaphS2]|nr:conserved hypothetical protein [delta proteobacterium NaphS2]
MFDKFKLHFLYFFLKVMPNQGGKHPNEKPFFHFRYQRL